MDNCKYVEISNSDKSWAEMIKSMLHTSFFMNLLYPVEKREIKKPQRVIDAINNKQRKKNIIALILFVITMTILITVMIIAMLLHFKIIGVRSYTIKYKYNNVTCEENVVITDTIERISSNQLEPKNVEIIHDFKYNLTAIVLRYDPTCYILPLDREKIKSPKNLIDLYEKVKSNYYFPNVTIIENFYTIQRPKLNQIVTHSFGSYICAECCARNTYHLIPIVKPNRNKRSTKNGFCLGDVYGEDTSLHCVLIEE